MSSNKTPQPEIFLALAIRISHTQLVARLFAYADTKGRITALRASLRQFQLPEEVISLVAEEIREQCFADTFAYYFTLSKCAANSCSVLEHFPKGYVVYEFGVRRTEDRYLEESGEIHENRLRTFYSTFKRKDGKGKINRASKVFFEDSGIRPYFMVSKKYHYYQGEWNGCDPIMEARAFLILPLLQVPVEPFPGQGMASFRIETPFDASALAGPSEAQEAKFRIAMSMLKVHIFDPDEDDERYVKKTKKDPKANRDWDSDDVDSSWEQDELDNDKNSQAAKNGNAEATKDVEDETADRANPEGIVDGESSEADGETSSAGYDKGERLVAQVVKPQLMMLSCGDIETVHRDW